MGQDSQVRRPARARRRLPTAIVYPSVLLTALGGCATQGTSRRSDRPESPRREQGPLDPLDEACRQPAGVGEGVVRTAAEGLSSDRPARPGSPLPSIPAATEYPIDLTTALRLAEAENPLIAEARQRVGEALALQLRANALMLPNLNAGTNYRDHQGNLQRSSGRILRLDEKSLYVGGGAATYAAGPTEVPAVSINEPLTDAVFEPLAARQVVEGARFEASATANRILREVAEHHFELLAAVSELGIRRLSASQAAEVARLTRDYAHAQQGRDADAHRAETEFDLIDREIQQAEEGVAVASARLARRLHLDQSVRLQPIPPSSERVTLIDPRATLTELIRAALNRRPEIGARSARVAAAEYRHKQEVYRPLLPTLVLGFSGGAFGGGSNLAPPSLAHFGGRTDFDVMAFWTLRNLGAGNASLQKQRWAEVGQAVGERSRAIAEVRSEVGAAFAEVAAASQQVDIATRRLASAEAGFQEDLLRIRNTVGRPIEVVNSLRLLNDSRVARLRAVTDYNKAEFRLFVALGTPPPLGRNAAAPLPPAPIASPLLPPLVSHAPPTDASGLRPDSTTQPPRDRTSVVAERVRR